jgi:predicted amidohydrolase
MNNELQVATVQFCHRANDKSYNLGIMERFIHQAAGEGTRILAFPEMCITGYWHVIDLSAEEVSSLAEPLTTVLPWRELPAWRKVMRWRLA